jgi:hypothetical protein
VKLKALEPLAVQQAGVAHPQGFNVVGEYVVPIKSDEDVRDSQGRCVVHSVISSVCVPGDVRRP